MNFFCSKDCPDLCGIKAEKSAGGFKFSGVANDWEQTGFVCSKFKVFAEREINNGLVSWQKTSDGKVSYSPDESVGALADFLEAYRGKKILYMRGSGSLAYNMLYWDVLFSSFENCWGTTGGPCDNTGGFAHTTDFGTELNPEITNLENADTIILYGKNAAVCSQHLYAYLKTLRKKGKHIIYIDPVKTKTASLADRYIMINPCCDGLLACALLGELGFESRFNTEALLERAGVSIEEFRHVADRIRSGKTAHIQGFGIQRQSNGMNAFQWINRLAVKTGCEDMLYFGHGSKRLWAKPQIKFKNHIHIDKIAKSLAGGGFDLFVNVAANPAMTYPDTNLWEKALQNTKTLVIDTNHSKTADHADFFFKVGGMFAQKDFMGSYFFTHNHQRDALTDELSDMQAAVLTGKKLGIDIQTKELSEIETVTQDAREYKTAELSLTIPEKTDRFRLFTASHHAYLNSQITEGLEQGLQVVYINRADAAELGIKDGDDVTVSNETGQFTAEALLTDGICRKTIMCWKNIPMKQGFTNNAIPNALTDSGDGLVYYTVFADVTRA
jgi:anaerobic selenocysteine-containing dehydrogenase